MVRLGILAALAGLLLAGASSPAEASGPQAREVRFSCDQGEVTAWLFQAPGNAARPAVLLLHGRSGVEKFREAYSRYAAHLAECGTDAYVVSYYDRDDAAKAGAPDKSARQRFFAERLPAWTARVRAVTDAALGGRKSNGRVGIVGFSQGGYLGVACSTQDERVSALVVMYGGIPSALAGNLKRLPPLLAFHGQADRTVPVAEGSELVRAARSLGGFAQLVVYPGEDHGFSEDVARDARDRAASFLRRELLGR